MALEKAMGSMVLAKTIYIRTKFSFAGSHLIQKECLCCATKKMIGYWLVIGWILIIHIDWILIVYIDLRLSNIDWGGPENQSDIDFETTLLSILIVIIILVIIILKEICWMTLKNWENKLQPWLVWTSFVVCFHCFFWCFFWFSFWFWVLKHMFFSYDFCP